MRALRGLLLHGVLVLAAEPLLVAAEALEPLLEITTKGPLEKQFLKEEQTWFRERLLGPQAKLWAEQPWAAEAQVFCEKALAAVVADGTYGETIKDLSPLADKLFEAGCKDPVVCYLAYHTHARWRDGVKTLDRATAAALDPGIKGALLILIADAKVQFEGWIGNDAPVFSVKLMEGLKKSLADGSYKAGEWEILLDHHRRSQRSWGSASDAVLAGLKEAYQKADLPDWVKFTLEGAVDVKLAWRARGGGWASTVTKQGNRGFAEHLQTARDELRRAWNLNPKCPDAATQMIAVAMGQGAGLESLLWFDRATAAGFDCPQPYYSLDYALTPKWGGSHELRLRLGLACARTRRFDTEVPAALWRACREVGRESGDPKGLYADPKVREALRAVQEGYLAEPGGEGGASKRHASMAAVAAYLMGDAALAAKALVVAGPKLGTGAIAYLESQGRTEFIMRTEVRGGLGDFGPQVAGLAQAALKRDDEEFKAKIRAIEPEGLPAGVAGYVGDLKFLDGFNERFETGEWVPLPVHPGLAAFSVMGGTCSTTPEGALVMEGTDDLDWTELVLRAPVFQDCEIKSEIEIIPVKGVKLRRRHRIIFGPVIGFQPALTSADPPPLARGLIFMSSSENPVEGLITGRDIDSRPRTPLPWASPCRLHFGIYEGRATLDMNGKGLMVNDELPKIGVTKTVGMPGFCARSIPIGGKLLVRHLEIRKSTARALDVMK